jgi:hypothetical protein
MVQMKWEILGGWKRETQCVSNCSTEVQHVIKFRASCTVLLVINHSMQNSDVPKSLCAQAPSPRLWSLCFLQSNVSWLSLHLLKLTQTSFIRKPYLFWQCNLNFHPLSCLCTPHSLWNMQPLHLHLNCRPPMFNPNLSPSLTHRMKRTRCSKTF